MGGPRAGWGIHVLWYFHIYLGLAHFGIRNLMFNIYFFRKKIFWGYKQSVDIWGVLYRAGLFLFFFLFLGGGGLCVGGCISIDFKAFP